MNTDDTPTPISVDDRFHGLPTGNAPRTHRPTKKPTGLNWGEIDAQYEANQGVRKEKIWAQGNVVIASRGGVHEQSFVERTDYEEPPIPPRPPVTNEIVETPKAPTTPRYDYDIWTSDPQPAPEVAEVVVPEGLDDVVWEDALAGERYDEPELAPEPQPADASDSEPRKGGRPRAFTPEQTADIVQRYNLGESTTSLAEAYGSNHATIWRTLDREGVKMRPVGSPPTTGSRRPAFTPEQEADVVRRYQAGESMESIATAHHTFATTVRRALLRNNVVIRHRGAPRQDESHHALKLREGDQPLPIVNDARDIQSQVIADIEARRQVGIQRYGTALQPHNGRDMLLDAYEEAMDLTIYLKGCLVERNSEARP
jgi:hypothetical protein